MVIEYRSLGTMSIDEFRKAIWTDLEILKDLYNVKYVRAPRLKIPITDKFGDHVALKRPDGKHIHRLATHHFRPACQDYDL